MYQISWISRINCYCSRSYCFAAILRKIRNIKRLFIFQTYPATYNNVLRKLNLSFIYLQLRKFIKFQSIRIQRILNAVLRNGITTNWCFIMTQSCIEKKKIYTMNCIHQGLKLLSSKWWNIKKHERITNSSSQLDVFYKC